MSVRAALTLTLALTGCSVREGTSERVSGGPAPASAPARCTDLASCLAACELCGEACAPAAAQGCKELGEQRLRGRESFDLGAAAAAFDRACQAGHGEACGSLGLLAQDGRGVPFDEARAAELYARACDLGAGVGCFNRAFMHQRGAGVDWDPAGAQGWFDRAQVAYRTACDRGEGAWCMNLGVMFDNGLGVARDPAAAYALYTSACTAGHQDSCVNAAMMELHGDVPARSDPMAQLNRACDAGSAVGCGSLGQALAQDRPGRPAAPERAQPLLEDACLDGFQPACGIAGAVLAMSGIAGLDDRIAFLQQRGCDLGDGTACLVTGLVALPPDPTADASVAVGWFRRACQIGDAEGCMRLAAHRQLGGRQVPVDTEEAQWAVVRSCASGLAPACYEVIRQGLPLRVPPDAAVRLRQEACKAGVAEGCTP